MANGNYLSGYRFKDGGIGLQNVHRAPIRSFMARCSGPNTVCSTRDQCSAWHDQFSLIGLQIWTWQTHNNGSE